MYTKDYAESDLTQCMLVRFKLLTILKPIVQISLTSSRGLLACLGKLLNILRSIRKRLPSLILTLLNQRLLAKAWVNLAQKVPLIRAQPEGKRVREKAKALIKNHRSH